MRSAVLLAVLAACASAGPRYWTPDYTETSTGYPDAPTRAPSTVEYCKCNPKQLWIDLAFVVDSTTAMSANGVVDVEATIQSIMSGLSLGSGCHQTRVAIITYGDTPQLSYSFAQTQGMSLDDIYDIQLPYLNSAKGNLTGALTLAQDTLGSKREGTKQAIVIFASSFTAGSNPGQVASQFKQSGKIIVVDYTQATGPVEQELLALASPGYNYTTRNQGTYDGQILMRALCDVNCYCADGATAYTYSNDLRQLPLGGCLSPVTIKADGTAASVNCKRKRGFLATVHDDDKQFALMQLKGAKVPYWIGLTYSNMEGWVWADNSTDLYTHWAVGQPNYSKGSCVYSQQISGFNSGWYTAQCDDLLTAFYEYTCQLPPCDSTFYCIQTCPNKDYY